MKTFLLQGIDFWLLFTAAVLVFGALQHWIWRSRIDEAVQKVTCLLAFLVLGGGWFWIESSALRELERMQAMVEGFAPTYAQELGMMGHEEITLATSPDNPRYWRMIAAQKRWVTANPVINDIFTYRKLPDGRLTRIVDSETDNNQDGRFDGQGEERTPIGKIYDGDHAETLAVALMGKSVFRNSPATDRRGTWVTAAAPIRNFRGEVEAAVGVEFEASTWVAAIRRARLTTITYLAWILLAIAVGTAFYGHERTRRNGRTLWPEQEEIRREKQKLETLVNCVDGIVWEADAQTFEFTFVSQRCESVLGYSRNDWLKEKNFWQAKLHPECAWACDHRMRMIAAKAPYQNEYRMIAADGRSVWIRESAAVMPDREGEHQLVRGVFYDITAQKRAALELEHAHAALVDSSRHAGMAEVATGVLHNVGNVLNSVNISGSVISERLRNSKVIELGKVSGLLTLQAADFAGFVARDPRGPHIPELISCVAEALRAEHSDLLEEVDALTRNIGHIREIVSMQQGFATGAGITEPFVIQTLVDDAIKINSESLSRHRITVVQAYEEVPKVLVDKHLILQILVNLLRNAKQAIDKAGQDERRIVIKIQNTGSGFVKVTVKDSGSGIAPENLTRIFSHGFTTKKTGHGFGLHSSALAASGMGGALSAHSDGPGTGATFVLEIPIAEPQAVAAAA